MGAQVKMTSAEYRRMMGLDAPGKTITRQTSRRTTPRPLALQTRRHVEPIDVADGWGFVFTAPVKLISANHRAHHHVKARATHAWRSAVATCTGVLPGPNGTPCWVTMVAESGVHDPSNLHPCLKAIVDGAVQGGWWPDDDTSIITTLEPVVRPRRRGNLPLVALVAIDRTVRIDEAMRRIANIRLA